MAVYTDFSDEEFARFVAGYDLGMVLSVKGIAEGVENSNYLLATEKGQFILTLYEKRVDPADLPFFLGLMEHLAEHGINCPLPVRDRAGNALGRLAERPAAIVTFLSGVSVRRPLGVTTSSASCRPSSVPLISVGPVPGSSEKEKERRLNWRSTRAVVRTRASELAPSSVICRRWPWSFSCRSVPGFSCRRVAV